MTSPTRRSFLETVSTLAAGSMIVGSTPGSLFAALPQGKPHIDFPTAPRERIAVASYPFRMYIDAPGNRSRDAKLKGFPLMQFPAELSRNSACMVSSRSRSISRARIPRIWRNSEAQYRSESAYREYSDACAAELYDPDASVRHQAVIDSKSGSMSSRGWLAWRTPAHQRIKDIEARCRSRRGKPPQTRGLRRGEKHRDHAGERRPQHGRRFLHRKGYRRRNHPYLRALPDFANSVLKGDLASTIAR